MLEEIKDAVIREARKNGEARLHSAEAELEAEFRAIMSSGDKRVADAMAEAGAMVETERRERISSAKLEAKRLANEAREDAVMEALEGIFGIIKDKKSKEFTARVKKLVAAGLSEFGGNAVVHVRKGEKKLYSIEGAEVAEDAKISGGAILESKDGRMRMDYSFESLFESGRDGMRKQAYLELFGGAKK
jgi:V/A-type H+/Na+-transporting ATPase subunit E